MGTVAEDNVSEQNDDGARTRERKVRPRRVDDSTALLLDAGRAAHLLGLGKSTFYRFDERGLIPRGARIGRLRRWSRVELERWTAAGCPPRHRWEESRE